MKIAVIILSVISFIALLLVIINKNKKIKCISGIVLSFGVLLISAYLCIPIFKHTNYGLDLQGGFEVLYQIEPLDGKELNSDMVYNTYKAILKRVDILGVNEPEISIEDGNRIRIALAGITNKDEAREVISSTAVLSFRDYSDNLLMTADVLGGAAKVTSDQYGHPAVSLSIKDNEKFYNVTNSVKDMTNNIIVIWLDYDENTDSYYKEKDKCGSLSSSRCLSAARVSQAFSSDVIIQGNFTEEEAKSLVELINSGSLPTKLTEISSRTVEATYGEASLNKTLIAGIIGICFVILTLVLLYHFSGFIAGVAVMLYTMASFLVFYLIQGTLTLPCIAAMLLGIGMAVDANVINFTRIRDELKTRKDLKIAYKKGNTESIKTVMDANITTLLVAIILFIFGESTIKGFATMLIISIITTLFVMVFLVRKVLDKMVETNYFNDKVSFFVGLKNKEIHNNFIKNMRLFISIPVVIIIAGIISLFTNKLTLGVEFKGGTSITIQAEQNLDINQIENDMEKLNYHIVTIDKIDEKTMDVTIEESLEQDAVLETEKNFNENYQASTDIGVVSNVVKQELVKNAIYAVILAAISIIIYISIRYRFSYAISGILALMHDLFMMIIFFSIFKLEVTPIFIAALLSIIGYSINNTIVTFDRIKENLNNKKLKTKEDLQEVVNDSISAIFTRSIITTITTLIPVVVLILVGPHEILNFNIALFIGLVAGAYSSLFISSFIWYLIEKNNVGKPPKKKWYEIDELEEKRVKGVNS